MACSVYIDDYRYLDRSYCVRETMRPYTMGCLTCASAVTIWAEQNGRRKQDLIWVFEKGDEDQNDLEKRWDVAHRGGLIDEPIFCKKVYYDPDKTACRRIRAFEAADLIAYEHLSVHRQLEEKQGADFYEDELSPGMLRMKKWPDAQDWEVCDMASLETLCAHWQVPERPRSSG